MFPLEGAHEVFPDHPGRGRPEQRERDRQHRGGESDSAQQQGDERQPHQERGRGERQGELGEELSEEQAHRGASWLRQIRRRSLDVTARSAIGSGAPMASMKAAFRAASSRQ